MINSKCKLLLSRLTKDLDLLFIIRENEANIDANGGKGISVREIAVKYENKFEREAYPDQILQRLRGLQDRDLVFWDVARGNLKLFRLSKVVCVFLDEFEAAVGRLDGGES